MMIAMFFMAVSCSAPGLCPTEAQLLAAVRRRDDAETRAIAEEMREGNPNVPVSIPSDRIIGITHIRCAQEFSDEPGWINCSYRVRYATRTILEIGQLSQDAEGWVLQDGRRATLKSH